MAQYLQKGTDDEFLTLGTSPAPGVHLVSWSELPTFLDGHCVTNLNVIYVRTTRKIMVFCKEHQPPPPPPAPPSWPKPPH